MSETNTQLPLERRYLVVRNDLLYGAFMSESARNDYLRKLKEKNPEQAQEFKTREGYV